jgi:hypothetical protein
MLLNKVCTEFDLILKLVYLTTYRKYIHIENGVIFLSYQNELKARRILITYY